MASSVFQFQLLCSLSLDRANWNNWLSNFLQGFVQICASMAQTTGRVSQKARATFSCVPLSLSCSPIAKSPRLGPRQLAVLLAAEALHCYEVLIMKQLVLKQLVSYRQRLLTLCVTLDCIICVCLLCIVLKHSGFSCDVLLGLRLLAAM